MDVDVAVGTWMRRRTVWLSSVVEATGALALLVLGVAGLWPLALFALIPAWFAFRTVRSGLFIDSDRVTLRGIARTHKLSLTEVEGFEPAILSPGALQTTIGVRLKRSGRRALPVWAMHSNVFGSPDRVDPGGAWGSTCERLDAALDAAGAHSS